MGLEHGQRGPCRSPAQSTRRRQQANAAALQRRPREYVLEVIGLGVSLDKHRQGKLWDALQKGHPFGTIREQDPEKYPGAKRQAGAEGAAPPRGTASAACRCTGQPLVCIGNPSRIRPPPLRLIPPSACRRTDSNGLDLTLFIPAGYMLADHPDRLLEKAFAFFDAHPDVPYLVVAASDGLYFRHLNRPPGSPPRLRRLLRPLHARLLGPLRPRPPRAGRGAAALRLRRHSQEDAAEQNRTASPSPLLRYDDLEQLGQAMGNGRLDRWPTVPEWLAETARFAKRPDVLGPESVSLLHPSDDVVHVPKGYKPTPWFPIPWNKYQLEVFDRLPTLGYLHRPTYIQLTDADGKPLTRQSDRTAALIKAGRTPSSPSPKPSARRPQAPHQQHRRQPRQARRAHRPDQRPGRSRRARAAPRQAQRMDQPRPRLGNTGSASWFMGMAIGVMGSYIDGGVSAAINLRNDREASLIFISPPPPEKLKAQGSAIFKNQVTPAIDPANYQQQ
jgi:hypothetical protein